MYNTYTMCCIMTLFYAQCKADLFFLLFFNAAQVLYPVREDRRYLEFQCELLSPETYVVDVQASVNPQLKNLNGETPWSEWSQGVEYTCPSLKPGPYIYIFIYI